MAQSRAGPKIKRHEFELKAKNYYDDHIGRITAISITNEKNVLLCDYEKNKLVLLDEDGKYINDLNLDSSPWDVAISSSNKAFVTLPNESALLTVDPDRLFVIYKTATTDFPDFKITSVSLNPMPAVSDVYLGCHDSKLSCYSFVPISYNNIANKVTQSAQIGINQNNCLYDIVVKHHTPPSTSTHLSCVSGQNTIFRLSSANHNYTYGPITIPGLRVPSDICSDNNGHVYVCGQYSNDIYRMDFHGNIIDTPFTEQHDIKNPVAMIFNRDCSRFYLVTEFGRCVRIYNVF